MTQPFQILTKPSSSKCNIDCDYCFYLEKEKLYPEQGNNWKMNEATLTRYIKAMIQSQPGQQVEFLWQGGEPTLLGIEFFEKAVALQKQFANGKQIFNSFQTNGIKINDAWARFLKDNGFLVGLSIDGSERQHDVYRKTRTGKPTYHKVTRAIELFQRNGVEFNALTVVNDFNVQHPMEVYRALTALGVRYMQFIPLVERQAVDVIATDLSLIAPNYAGKSNVAPWSVDAVQYGNFLTTLFDHWLANDVGKVFIMNFEQSMQQLIGGIGSCVHAEVCGANLAMEANGDVYACDHFVYPEHKLGNLHTDSLVEMVNSEKQQTFSIDKLDRISVDCHGCSVRHLCHGGCPKHRFETSSDGTENRNYLCQGYKAFFQHAEPHMKQLLTRMGLRNAVRCSM